MLKGVQFYKNLEHFQSQLKKKKLNVSEAKLAEYDQLLAHIEVPKIAKVSSHKHELKRHPQGHHNGWRCDHIKGLKRCLSGMNDFYQAQSAGIYGWRCQMCDFDLCMRCMKAEKYIEQILERED